MSPTEPSPEHAIAATRRLFELVVSQMRKDPEFARAAAAAIVPTPPRRGGRRPPAVLDPLAIWREDSASLEARLRELDVEQLKDVVSHYGLDPSRLALKWKTPDRLIKLIVEAVEAQARKGDAFRAPSSGSEADARTDPKSDPSPS